MYAYRSLVMFLAACAVTPSLAISAQEEALPHLVPESIDGSLHAVEFRAAPTVAWIDDRTLVTIDIDDQQLVRLGLNDGNERRTGGEGKGPGEMTGAFQLAVDGSGRVLVSDMDLRRLTAFGPDLSYAGSVRADGMPVGVTGWDGHTAIALWLGFGRDGMEPVVVRVDLDSESHEVLFEPFFSDVDLEPDREENPFAPTFFALSSDRDGLLLFGRADRYRVAVFDASGNLTGSFGRPDIDPRYPTEEEKDTARDRAVRAGGGPPPPGLEGAAEDALDRPIDFFQPGGFAVDGSGRLWVITTRVIGDATEVDVFNRTGVFVGTVTMAGRVQALAFRADRVAAVVQRTEDAFDGFSGFDVYRIEN